MIPGSRVKPQLGGGGLTCLHRNILRNSHENHLKNQLPRKDVTFIKASSKKEIDIF